MAIYVIFLASTYGNELYTESFDYTDKEKAEKAFREYCKNAVAEAYDYMSDKEVTSYVDGHTDTLPEYGETKFHMEALDYETVITLREIKF